MNRPDAAPAAATTFLCDTDSIRDTAEKKAVHKIAEVAETQVNMPRISGPLLKTVLTYMGRTTVYGRARRLREQRATRD
jgi:hypothetical protein